MFYLQNKNRHPSGPLPEKNVKMGWHSTANKYSPHTQSSASASPATSYLASSDALPPSPCCFSLNLAWPPLLPGGSSFSSPLSTSLVHQRSPPSTFIDRWRLKWIVSVLWNFDSRTEKVFFMAEAKIIHLLWCELGWWWASQTSLVTGIWGRGELH